METEGIDKLDLTHQKFRFANVETKYDLYVDNLEVDYQTDNAGFKI